MTQTYLPVFPCPDCGGEVDLYDFSASKKKGRYKCHDCGRNAFYSVGNAESMNSVVMRMHQRQRRGSVS